MTGNPHRYALQVQWTGNRGEGTHGYRSYERSYDLNANGKPTLAASADATFRGDRTKWNPEEMLLGALSGCHLLSYLHVCADAGISVLEYRDEADGEMILNADGSGRFTAVTLRPHVVIAEGGDAENAQILHHLAHEKCFIANSVNFPVSCDATIAVRSADPVSAPAAQSQ